MRIALLVCLILLTSGCVSEPGKPYKISNVKRVFVIGHSGYMILAEGENKELVRHEFINFGRRKVRIFQDCPKNEIPWINVDLHFNNSDIEIADIHIHDVSEIIGGMVHGKNAQYTNITD